MLMQNGQVVATNVSPSDVSSIKSTGEDTNTKVGSIKTTVESTNTTVGTVNTNVNTVKTDVGTIKSNVSSVKTTVEDTNTKASAINTSVGTINTNVNTVKSDVTTVKSNVSSVKTTVEDTNTKVGTVNTNVNTVKTDVGTVKSNVSSVKTTVEDTNTKVGTANTNLNAVKKILTPATLNLSKKFTTLQSTGDADTFTIERSGSGAITVTSLNPAVATVAYSNGTATITAVGKGYGVIRVTVAADSNYGAVEAEVNVHVLETVRVEIYGVKINKTDSNPATRVTYTDDAVGKTPASMNFTSGAFDYGSWANAFFVKKNYPCMLNSDGTVAYKLDPNDYSKKEDGSASDVANTAFDGNAMSSIPLTYVYLHEDSNYEYIQVSNAKVNDNFEPIAHTKEDGTVVKEIFLSMFRGSLINDKLRSLSGQAFMMKKTAQEECNYAKANNPDARSDTNGWYTKTWGQRTLINCFLILMGCSTNSQAVYGEGWTTGGSESALTSARTGFKNTSGQFYGSSTNNSATERVKVFHIEDWWGTQWDRIAGLINDNGTVKVSMKGPYNFDGSGYNVIGTYIITSNYIVGNTLSNTAGRLPISTGGGDTQYDCDKLWWSVSAVLFALVGAYCGYGSRCGFATLGLYAAASGANWYVGASLSYV